MLAVAAEKLAACRELRLRQVCRSLRRSAGVTGGRCRRVTGVRPDLLPSPASAHSHCHGPAAAMSRVSRSATPRSAALSRTKSVSWAGERADDRQIKV